MNPRKTRTIAEGIGRLLPILLSALFLAACPTQRDNRQTAPLPADLAESVEAGGSRFAAVAYVDREQAMQAFGSDIRAAGLLPLRITIDNRGGNALKIIPRETFLIDLDGQGWPLLAADQAFSRLEQAGLVDYTAIRRTRVDDPDSLTGFAIDMKPGEGFSRKPEATPWDGLGQGPARRRPRNPVIQAGKTAAGILFFPGRDEARSARALRLSYQQDGQTHLLHLPLKSPSPVVSR